MIEAPPTQTDCERNGQVTHAMLVQLAAKWLATKCAVVLTELATTGEEPDAIGWKGTHSILIECKASREDYRCDSQKWFRREPERGVGQQRYFLSLPGVIRPESLPLRWGLLELTGARIRKVRESETFETNHRHEIGILLSTIRRIGGNAPTGVSVRCYTIVTQNRATLGVCPPVPQASQASTQPELPRKKI